MPVLDATAITVSMLRGDFNTAGSIMFLLGIGDTLDEWTHKKSVGDLARSMALNVDKVWLQTDDGDVLVPVSGHHGRRRRSVLAADPQASERRAYGPYPRQLP